MTRKNAPSETLTHPTGRHSAEAIAREAAVLRQQLPSIDLLDQLPHALMALNHQRQIVYANRAAQAAMSAEVREQYAGLRPGEVLDCQHAQENLSGCGTSKFCQACGAALAIQQGLTGEASEEECRITRQDGSVLDLKVNTLPLEGEEIFLVFFFEDISDLKRRQVLEKTFFHDLSNTLTRVNLYMDVLPKVAPEERQVYWTQLVNGIRQLTEEIDLQRSLLAAEEHRLVVRKQRIQSLDLLLTLQGFWRYRSSEGSEIHLDQDVVDVEFIADRTLLSRVLGNMLKNALEASPPNERILLGCERRESGILQFWVNNAQVMAPDIQLQVFKRSFSTKGEGRGIGTYGMKLLAEGYLHGEVGFQSHSKIGTTFWLNLPIAGF